MLYTIVYNIPGCLPEMDPYEVNVFNLAEAIGYVRAEVERMAEEDDPDNSSESWNNLLDEISGDEAYAASLSEEGVRYTMPNGYVIEATLQDWDKALGEGRN